MTDTERHTTKDRKFFLQFFLNRNILFAYALLILLPVFFSCDYGSLLLSEGSFPETSGNECRTSVKVRLRNVSDSICGPSIIDIFVFNNDGLGRLDSYQRIEACLTDKIPAASRMGDKILAVIANSGKDASDWAEVNSIAGLYDTMSDIADENPASPLMCGIADVSMGSEQECTIEMAPLLASVCLKSIRCDFSGRPYAGAPLTDVRAYLINVSAQVPLFRQDDFIPAEIINAAGLSDYDMGRMLHPEMLFSRIENPIGPDAVSPGINLYCYPNTSREESIGSPYTRLVIEGKILGKTFYYPININRNSGNQNRTGDGIFRSCRYVFDVTITRCGTNDPDIPADPSMIKINMMPEPWEEIDEDRIDF